MAAALSQARQVARQAAEMLYEHSCDIMEYRTRRVKGESKQKPVAVQRHVPCRLVFPANPVSRTESTADIGYDALVIMPPDIKEGISQGFPVGGEPDTGIAPGSLLVVTHGGGVGTYEQSGEPLVFATHQEIKVRRVGRA